MKKQIIAIALAGLMGSAAMATQYTATILPAFASGKYFISNTGVGGTVEGKFNQDHSLIVGQKYQVTFTPTQFTPNDYPKNNKVLLAFDIREKNAINGTPVCVFEFNPQSHHIEVYSQADGNCWLDGSLVTLNL